MPVSVEEIDRLATCHVSRADSTRRSTRKGHDVAYHKRPLTVSVTLTRHSLFSWQTIAGALVSPEDTGSIQRGCELWLRRSRAGFSAAQVPFERWRLTDELRVLERVRADAYRRVVRRFEVRVSHAAIAPSTVAIKAACDAPSPALRPSPWATVA
jgi:hypothetical protein